MKDLRQLIAEATAVSESTQKNEGKSLDDISTKEIAAFLKTLGKDRKYLRTHDSEIGAALQKQFKLSYKPNSIELGNLFDTMPKEYLESTQNNKEDLIKLANKITNRGSIYIPVKLLAAKLIDRAKQQGLHCSSDDALAAAKTIFRESAQMNEAKTVKATIEIEVNSNLDNKKVEQVITRALMDKKDALQGLFIKDVKTESAQKNEGGVLDYYYAIVGDVFASELDKGKKPSRDELKKLAANEIKKRYHLNNIDMNLLEQAIKEFKGESAQKNEAVNYKGKYHKGERVLAGGKPAIVKDIKAKWSPAGTKSLVYDVEFDSEKGKIKTYDEIVLSKLRESAQINESKHYEVIIDANFPDNMNNRQIEDKFEEILAGRGYDIYDITANRK